MYKIQAAEFFNSPCQYLKNRNQWLEFGKTTLNASPLAQKDLRELGVVTNFIH